MPRLASFLSWPDLKLSLRLLVKHPGLTMVSTVGIAVGIAITAGMFGFAHAMFAPTLPLDEGDRIVALENWNIAKNNEDQQSLHDFATWRDEMRSVVEISAFRTITATMQAGDHVPETVRVAAMSASGFRVARVPALVGRFVMPEDERDAAPPVVVIGHSVWQSRFGMDRSVVGQQVRLGTTHYNIVGVMPEGFAFPVNHQYWIAHRTNPSAFARGAGPELFVFGRLAPGATMASAQAELSVIGQRAAAVFPQTNATLKPQVLEYTKPINDIQDTTIGAWVGGQLMVSLVLVVVALNVAILLYARTATRRGEIAVRTALGASRGRIVTQLFVEALVLAVVPALLGIAIAQYVLGIGTRILALELGGAAPFWWDYSVQPSTLVYVLALVVMTAAIAGILPALHATRTRGGADIRQLGGSTGMRLGRMWSALIVVQVAFAVAVLPTAIKVGVTQIRIDLTGPNYPVEEFVAVGVATDSGSNLFGTRLLEVKRRLQAEPDVAGVTFAATLAQRNGTGRIEVEGVPAATGSTAPAAPTTFGVDTDYLDVYGLAIVAGRSFNALDAGVSNNPVIVDRNFVRDFLNGEAAVGRRLRYGASAASRQPSPWYEIIGVSENHLRNPIDPDVVRGTLIYPLAPDQLSGASLRLRLRGPAGSRLDQGFARKVHQIVAVVDPRLRTGEVRAGAAADTQGVLALRLVAIALSLVLLTVLLFSAAGVYSLMSFTVAHRRREIGIRTALGASRLHVLRDIFARVALQVAAGVMLGVVVATAIESPAGGAALRGRLAVVTPAIVLIMVIVGLAAAYGPARRSLRIQPTEALRAE